MRKQTWIEHAMAFKTSSRNSGGVIDWTVAKSMLFDPPGYPDGSALSNLKLKSVPANDCVLDCEKRSSCPENRAH
jgi:hypothetical protein